MILLIADFSIPDAPLKFLSLPWQPLDLAVILVAEIAGYTIADHLESRPKTGWVMRLPAAVIEGFRGIGAEGVLPRGRTGEPRRHEQRFTAGRCIPRRCPGDRKGLTLLD